jgi:hypothetical protein
MGVKVSLRSNNPNDNRKGVCLSWVKPSYFASVLSCRQWAGKGTNHGSVLEVSQVPMAAEYG